jgi:transcriptional regulator with PAS, ATPase and Fis domain
VVQVEDLPSTLRKVVSRSHGQNEIRPLVEVKREVERFHILYALEKTKGDKKLAAEKLNIGLTSLYRRLKNYGSLEGKNKKQHYR